MFHGNKRHQVPLSILRLNLITSFKFSEVDLEKGDMYFCTEEEAEEAGFEKAGSCK